MKITISNVYVISFGENNSYQAYLVTLDLMDGEIIMGR